MSFNVPLGITIVAAADFDLDGASDHPLADINCSPNFSETERANKQLSDEWLKTAIEYKHEWEQELARRLAPRDRSRPTRTTSSST